MDPGRTAVTRVWVDLANSPHVATLEPVVAALRERGDDVFMTARDHAQTVELARRSFPDDEIVASGAGSPSGRLGKGRAIAVRARELWGVARRRRPDVALSHGSYAQLLAARAARVPGVTMMDYEHQPANHLSFRLASRVVVPNVFPADALRRFGARDHKVVRYPGFKEELYLGTFRPDEHVLDELGLDRRRVIVVLRPAPEGALYHRGGNESFERLVQRASSDPNVQVVLLPRGADQLARYRGASGIVVPDRAVDGRSLLVYADVMIGGGGTMNREAAILGTPTYTIFAGRLAAVDAELIRMGLLHDLRDADTEAVFVKKPDREAQTADGQSRAILARVLDAVDSIA
jgi:predicted glycosyltransferase